MSLRKSMTAINVQELDHTLLVTLNRPEVRNAMNLAMMKELRQLWQDLKTPNQTLRCIILTGAPPAFCAGADLKERNGLSLSEFKAQRSVLEEMMWAMLDCPLPTIAAVNGAAFGGGLEITLACDFAYAAKEATFALPEVKIGLMPAALGTQHLPRAAGLARAKEIVFTGNTFTAEDAYQWGIINKLCPAESVLVEAKVTAKKISENAPLAIKQAKQALNMSRQLDIKSGFSFEIEAYNLLLPTRDREEGIRAFNEKRKPVFNGE